MNDGGNPPKQSGRIIHAMRSTFITIYDDGSPSRVGVEVGVGTKAKVYLDPPTGATILVEFKW